MNLNDACPLRDYVDNPRKEKIVGKLEDWDKATKAKQKEQELYKSNSFYRSLINQICSASSKILRVEQEIKKLSEKQVELKRGRAALVELRRDLLSRTKTGGTNGL